MATTDKQTDIHTHVHNAVTLVWGSLRLAPISDSDYISWFCHKLKLASSPGLSQILFRPHFLVLSQAKVSLVPRSLPDFISQPWRKIDFSLAKV